MRRRQNRADIIKPITDFKSALQSVKVFLVAGERRHELSKCLFDVILFLP
jgi:hypothetical protein